MKIRNHASSPNHIRLSVFAAVILALALGLLQNVNAQSTNSFNRQRGLDILRMVKSDLQKNYYDSTFHGANLEASFKEAEEMIKKAQSNGQIFGIIANVLVQLNDSHTTFLPPSRVAHVEYGWQMQAFGDNCYVSAVRLGSDAEAKGLKPGDQILSIDGIKATREDLWKIEYLYYALRPQGGMQVVVQSPDGKQRQLDILAKINEGKHITDLTNYTEYMRYLLEGEKEDRLSRSRFVENDGDTIIWKMPGFNIPDDSQVDSIMSKVKKFKALILDLRGNGGGYVVMLERLLGHFFDHDIKIADLKGRKEMKPSIAKTRGPNYFKGQVVVLIDSKSASAAEVFARVMQIEKRGIVIGDRSSGKVMQSKVYPREVGLETVAFFGTNITNADLIMTDGNSLEHVGVTPDELVLPTAEDMAAGRDPVMARAAGIIGFKLDPIKAGTLFPIEWRK